MDNDKNKRSALFTTAIIGIPTGVGAYKTWQAIRSVPDPTIHSPLSSREHKTHQTLTQVVNKYANPEQAVAAKDWQLQQVKTFAQSSQLTADEIRTSLYQAARRADPTGGVENLFSSRLATAASGEDVLRDLHGILSSSTSIHTQRAASLFLEDIGVLQNRLDAGLSTKTSVFQNKINRIFKSVNPQSLDPRTRADIFKMAEALDASVKLSQISRGDGVPGSELVLNFTQSSKLEGDLTLNIPRVWEKNKGVVTRGATQQSRYITGMYGELENGVIKATFNSEQFAIRRAADELVPGLLRDKVTSQRAVNNAAYAFMTKHMESAEWIPSTYPGEHSAVEQYMMHRANVMHLFTQGENGLAPINEYQYYDLMSKGGAATPEGNFIQMFPGHSAAQIAGGTVSTKDARSAASLVPEAVPFGQRPLRFLRNNYAPLAPELIRGDATTRNFKWAATNVGVETPMARIAYVSSKHDAALVGQGISSEGQGIITRRMSGLRAVSQWAQYDISSSLVGPDLESLLDRKTGTFNKINKQLPAGAFLGKGPDGLPIILDDETTISHVVAFEKDKEKGDFLRVMARKDIENTELSKAFLATKGMIRETGDEQINSVLRETLGAPWLKQHMLHEVDAIVTMDDLRKNPGLHYNQMFTALWDFTKQNINSGKTSSLLASNFANDPTKMVDKIRAIANKGDQFSNESMMHQIVGLARYSKLDPQQMGRVFGAVPEVFGGLDVLGKLSATEQSEINRGIATGVGQMFYGGPSGPGSGAMSTIEPRMWEGLDSLHFGPLGAEIKSDIANRMSAMHPEKYFEQNELSEALTSIHRPGSRTGATSATDILAGLGKDEIVPATSTSLKLKGIGDVYIPGAAHMSQLSSRQTAANIVVHTDLAKQYAGLLGAASKYESGQLSQEKMAAHLTGLQDTLVKEYTGTVTGKGGLLRSKLPGSVSLTGVLPVAGEELPDGVAGITGNQGQKIFRQMKKLGIYEDAALASMQERFIAGEAIPGLLTRHPAIGAHSIQASMIQKIAGEHDAVVLSEKLRRAAIFRGQLNAADESVFAEAASRAFRGSQSVAARIEELGGELKNVRLGSMAGHAGDIDGDTYGVVFGGPQLQASLTEHIKDPVTQRAYEDYALRQQLLKAKASAKNISLAQAAAGDALKLGVTEQGRLGKLSSRLQQNRAALLSNPTGLSTQRQLNAQALLEWLEQTPISGKHIEPGREREMMTLIDNMSTSLQKNSASGIIEATNSVLAHAKSSGLGAIDEGITVALENSDGRVETRFVEGVKVQQAAQDIISAKQMAEKIKVGNTTMNKMRQLMFGRGKANASDVSALLNPEALASSPFGAFFKGTEKVAAGKFASVAQNVLTRANKLGVAGKSMLEHARPLGLGIGAGLALAAVLSEPPRSISAGSNTPPQPNLTSGTGGANLGYGAHPHEQQMGEPTAANLGQSHQTARLAQNDDVGYRIDVRGRSGSSVDMNNLNRQMRNSLGRNSNTSSSIKDQRGSLSPQRLASILAGN